MTSKEALDYLCFIALGNEKSARICKEVIEKDLDIFECFQKIDKKELKDFIETQIKYVLNENTWLSACNCDLGKEKPTKHLIKIKEWIEDDN